MTPLPLTLTDAGIAALRAASGTNQLEIVSVGLSASAIVVSRTLTALPGEHRRIGTIAGEAIDAFTVHMVARDDTDATYTVRAIALYLADDTLFAVYGQADPLFEKAAVASYHQAIDLRFEGGDAGAITFGDANFLMPPATESRAGVAAIATQAVVDDGEDQQRIVTPRTLGQRLQALLATIFARRIDTAGLLTGGGPLDQDRILTVQVASAAEADAGAIGNKAVVPASLVNLLSSIAARVPLVRRIDTDGLALGGGSMTTDRTISVPKATSSQLLFAMADNVAVTPASFGGLRKSLDVNGYYELPGGMIVQWMRYRALIQNEPTLIANYPVAFPNACLVAAPFLFASSGTSGRDMNVHLAGNPGAASCQVKFQAASDAPVSTADGYDLILIGY